VAIQQIRVFGDPVLRTPAQPVRDFDRELRTLVKDLFETMLDAPGVGLAAPQIGVSLRVFAYHLNDTESGHLVNPELVYPDQEEQDGPEGCLSLPGLTFDCIRRMNVVARGWNMFGDPVEVAGTQLLARCLQHETDHLDGVLFVDRLDPETKKAAMRAIREAEWAGEPMPTVRESPHRLFGRAL